MYWYTIVGAGGFGLGIIVIPNAMKSGFGWPSKDPIVFGVTGSVYLSFALLSILGLIKPTKMGNRNTLARQSIKSAEYEGAEVEIIYLHGMNISPCQGCYACQRKDSKGCAIDDDMQPLYPKLIEADTWIISSPVYWFTMSAQTKLFMDRCFALFSEGPNVLTGKRIGIAMSYGDSDPFISGCVNALRTFQDAYNYVGAKIIGTVYGSAQEPGEIASNSMLMEERRRWVKR